MSQQYRPENVLRRAEDLLALDQADKALGHLHQFIVHKRTRNLDHANPQLVQVLKLFIDIAVDRRDSRVIKDGLHQFKKGAVGSGNGLESLEVIVKHLLEAANSKLAHAQSQANDAAELANEQSHASALEAKKAFHTVNEDDEEEEEAHNQDEDDEDDEEAVFNVSPENILLSAVSTDDSVERSNKEFFLPWLKFIWEAYRTVVDLLKNNNQLETPYCYVVGEVFKFCEKYQRFNEFKKFCEILRIHLLSVVKPGYAPPQETPDAINISKPDSLQRLLETRFLQLSTAVKLQLWKESFKSVEDVHYLMKYAKKSPKPSSLVLYYNNLATIFQISDNMLYDAAARLKLFNLLSQNPNVTEEELKSHASLQLLSALTIPLQANGTDANINLFSHNDIIDSDYFNRKNNKMASLLNLKQSPSKQVLLNVPSILEYADSDLLKLFYLLEGQQFNALTFSAEVNAVLEKIINVEAYAPYLSKLKTILSQKIILNISSIYETIKFEFLIKLTTFKVDFFNHSEFELEDLLLNIEQTELLPNHYVEYDFELGVVIFIPKLNNSDATDLSQVMNTLSQAIKLINVKETEESHLELVTRLSKAANESFDLEVETLEQRFVELKAREKKLKDLKEGEDMEFQKQKAEQLQEAKRLEKERLENDEIRLEEDRIRKERERIQREEMKKLIEEVNKKGVISISMEEAEKMTTDQVKRMQIDQLELDHKNLVEKLESTSKRVDYLERAQREAELPLLQKEVDKVVDVQMAEYETMKNALIEKAKVEYEANLKVKQRLSRFVNEYEEIVKQCKDSSYEQYQREKLQAKEQLEEAKKARIAQFISEKKKEFEAAQAKAKAEEEAILKAEEAAKMREEAAKAREDAARARVEEEAAAAKKAAEEAAKKPMTFAEKMRLKKLGLL